ncbi:MAG: phasin family protein [Thiohalocapsa sp.]
MTEFNRGERTGSEAAPGTIVAAAMLREAEAWARTQGELLTGFEAIWAAWMKRQSEAVDATAQTLRRMLDCRSAVEVVQLQQQWVAEALRRATVDFGSAAQDTVAMTQRAVAADRFNRPPAQPAPQPESAPQRAAAE